MEASHGGGGGKGVVGLPILEKTTNAEGTPEEAAGRLSQIHNPVPEVNPDSMNQDADPSFQTPVKIGLAPACLEMMMVYG